MFFDPMYLVMMAPALILAAVAQFLVKSTFKKYSKIGIHQGLTGAEAAHAMLERHGVSGIRIEAVPGRLTDHYDPRSRTLRLSEPVYGSRSLSAVGVACHEAGHAIQHADGYKMLALRSTLVPATNFSTKISYFFIIAGFLFSFPGLVGVGAVLFSLAVVFALVTLPVEWDASRRAKLAMASGGIISPEEAIAASKVLNAAFLTYVAAAVSALMTMLYYLMRSGLLGSRR